MSLLGIVIFHRRNLELGVAGLIVLVIFKMAVGEDLAAHFLDEVQLVPGLLDMLLGFAILARHFGPSGVPDGLPRFLRGGSMIRSGSGAGATICNHFPKAKNTGRWLEEGWPIVAASALGFGPIYLILGWHPDPLPIR